MGLTNGIFVTTMGTGFPRTVAFISVPILANLLSTYPMDMFCNNVGDGQPLVTVPICSPSPLNKTAPPLTGGAPSAFWTNPTRLRRAPSLSCFNITAAPGNRRSSRLLRPKPRKRGGKKKIYIIFEILSYCVIGGGGGGAERCRYTYSPH